MNNFHRTDTGHTHFSILVTANHKCIKGVWSTIKLFIMQKGCVTYITLHRCIPGWKKKEQAPYDNAPCPTLFHAIYSMCKWYVYCRCTAWNIGDPWKPEQSNLPLTSLNVTGASKDKFIWHWKKSNEHLSDDKKNTDSCSQVTKTIRVHEYRKLWLKSKCIINELLVGLREAYATALLVVVAAPSPTHAHAHGHARTHTHTPFQVSPVQ